MSPTTSAEEPAGTPSAPATPPVTEPGPDGPAGPPATPVDVAIADLVTRTGVDVADIAVTRDEEVTWRDGSLGCAKKGMGYITVLVPGRLIVLEAAGKTYEYHSGAKTPPFLCSDPQPPLPPGSSGT